MSVTTMARPARTTMPAEIRVLPAPRTEPPHDGELVALGIEAPPPAAPFLPLDLPTGVRVQRNRRRPSKSGQTAAPGGLALVQAAAGGAATGAPAPVRAGAVQRGAEAATGTPVAAPGAGGQPARLAVRRLVASCVEVLGGFRPVAQLRPFCAPEVFDTIAQRLLGRPVSQHGYPGGRSGPAGGMPAPPPRPTRPQRPGPPDRVRVLRVQVCEVSDEVLEVVAVLSRREKVWAMAVRIERIGARWLCSHLELV